MTTRNIKFSILNLKRSCLTTLKNRGTSEKTYWSVSALSQSQSRSTTSVTSFTEVCARRWLTNQTPNLWRKCSANFTNADSTIYNTWSTSFFADGLITACHLKSWRKLDQKRLFCTENLSKTLNFQWLAMTDSIKLITSTVSSPTSDQVPKLILAAVLCTLKISTLHLNPSYEKMISKSTSVQRRTVTRSTKLWTNSLLAPSGFPWSINTQSMRRLVPNFSK